MKHLILSRELPPAPYAAGGIGAYVDNIARLLAARGETVHLIGQRWDGAPEAHQVLMEGRLIIHRIGAEDLPAEAQCNAARAQDELQGLRASVFPEQWFAWSAAFLAERLVEEEDIDIIEAQEWEAPLYYFLLRRSLGLGPTRRPPCVVHLHSPSTFIHHFNGPLISPPRLPLMKRMEEFCIQSADGLLCPSRSLARDAARHYRLQPETIEVIPLPVGFSPALPRAPDVWANGSICYVGRLEPRKGVIEWVDAAIRVAREDPKVHFDLVGADIWNLRGPLQEQVGATLTPRFRFHGAKSRAEIADILAQAKAAVVPSRWENFPNVCIEAMASGLPVIATRNGAMAEMVVDGRTGWLAADTGVAGLADSLAEALRRCLATQPEDLAAMGARASEDIQRYCNNDAVIDAQLRFRSQLATRGAQRSVVAIKAEPIPRANVVVRAPDLAAAEDVLQSVTAQTLQPVAVALVVGAPVPEHAIERLRSEHRGFLLLSAPPGTSGTQAWNLGAQALAARSEADFWLFLDEHDRLEPECLQQMAHVFSHRPDAGVVSPWTWRTGSAGGLDARPSPTPLYQLTGNDVAPGSGFRAAALDLREPFRPGLPREHDVWALANAVIANGWGAVTLPSLLARREGAPSATPVSRTALRAIRAEALAPFDTDGNRLALQLVDAFVPLAGDGEATTDGGQRLRRLALRYLEALLLRPRDVARRVLSLGPELLSRGAVKS